MTWVIPPERGHTVRTSGRLTAAVFALALGCSACASGDATDDGTDDGEDAAGGSTIEVVTTDYAFAMPDEVSSGTTLTLRNDSAAEVHEALLFKLPADDTRSVDEIVASGEEGMAGAEFSGVLMAGPGDSATTGPLGPAVLDQSGRYLVICFLPTGAPPEEVFAAVDAYVDAGAPEDGAPEYPETGPPHAANGMYTELTVVG